MTRLTPRPGALSHLDGSCQVGAGSFQHHVLRQRIPGAFMPDKDSLSGLRAIAPRAGHIWRRDGHLDQHPQHVRETNSGR